MSKCQVFTSMSESWVSDQGYNFAYLSSSKLGSRSSVLVRHLSMTNVQITMVCNLGFSNWRTNSTIADRREEMKTQHMEEKRETYWKPWLRPLGHQSINFFKILSFKSKTLDLSGKTHASHAGIGLRRGGREAWLEKNERNWGESGQF